MTVIAGDSAAASGTSPNPDHGGRRCQPRLVQGQDESGHSCNGTFEENNGRGGASGSVRRPTSLAADSSG